MTRLQERVTGAERHARPAPHAHPPGPVRRPARNDRHGRRATDPPRPSPRREKAPRAIAIGLAACLLLAVLTLILTNRSDAEGDSAEQAAAAMAPPPPSVVSGAYGQPVEISASGPEGVLLAFCAAGPLAAERVPVGIAPTRPFCSTSRLGMYREGDSNAFRGIEIRKEGTGRRWVAGNGSDPIVGIAVAPPIRGWFEPVRRPAR